MSIKDINIEILTDKNPWFIKEYKGRIVVTIRDIKELIGVNIDLKKLNINNNIFRGQDWNGIGGVLKERFEKDNNVRYEEEIIFFVYITGFLKILKILMEDRKIDLLEAESILRTIDDKIKSIP